MLSAFLFTLIPTLFVYFLLPKIGITIRSAYLKIALSWFAGLYFFTICTFIVALIYAPFMTGVLSKAAYTMLFAVQLSLIFFVKDLGKILIDIKKLVKHSKKDISINSALIISCLLFSYLFFSPHLKMEDNVIYRSPIYWDFHWHAGLIQSFVLGDNFPPQNESFGGIAHTYHYFWAVAAGIFAATGLDLVLAINFISIVAFFFLLITLIGCSETFFHSKKAGLIAVLLMITSSSLHFVFYFLQHPDAGMLQSIINIATNTTHPFNASFIRGRPFEYSGTMFNLFYFLEERQMIFGVIYLMFSIWMVSNRINFSNKLLFFLGMCMGGYFLWHLHITIMVFCMLLLVLLIGNARKKTLILFSGFALVFGAHYLYLKEIFTSPWFSSAVSDYPKFNNAFSNGLKPYFSWSQFFGYYGFAYGAKVIFFFISVILLWKHNKQLCIVLLAAIIPAFIFLNTMQISPAAISENHKWLRPMNVIIDLTTAYALFVLFFNKHILWRIVLGIICMYLLMISGVIELMPFLNSKPTKTFAEYPSPLTSAIIKNTKPTDIIVGNEPIDMHLSGRRLFVGNTLGGDMNLKTNERKQIVISIYKSVDLKDFCDKTTRFPIDYVAFTSYENTLLLSSLPKNTYFTAKNNRNKDVTFINVKKVCTLE